LAKDTVGIQTVRVDDVVVVKPGSRLPVDGVVIAGQSFVDEATITGESLPVEQGPGSHVYAGTINQSGMLEVRVARVGRDTAFGKIIDAVERAEASRAPIQKIADRLAGHLVYFALSAAALTFLLTRDARSTIAVVIVAGACGIAAGTPLAILGAIGQAARRGVIIKGGLPLELLAHVDTAVFDKTGTLTEGKPTLVELVASPGVEEPDILRLAAGLEVGSEHPLAVPIVRGARVRDGDAAYRSHLRAARGQSNAGRGCAGRISLSRVRRDARAGRSAARHLVGARDARRRSRIAVRHQ